jgi:hypothetical protein
MARTYRRVGQYGMLLLLGIIGADIFLGTGILRAIIGPVTSAVVFGAGVRGGALCGATDDLMVAMEVDLQTGAAGNGGEALYPEQVLAGILELVGVDPQAYYPGVTALRGFHA